MNKEIKKIGILTGGGDCPGLNAVIRGATLTAIRKYNLEVIGYTFGYRGLYNNEFINLDEAAVSGIGSRGGTILFSSNKDNLFNYDVTDENGKTVKKDVSDIAIANLKKENVDVLIVIGGDGTLTSARDFARKGVRVIGVPKTIDNDLDLTDVTFGFNSAVDVATDALERLRTTARSHHRIMVLEVMGRHAGWIALESGIAGSAHVILLPEIPYKLDNVISKINERKASGELFSIVVVAEGASEEGGEQVISKIVADSPDPIRLGGIGNKVAYDLERKLGGHEVRCTVLGHLQRGGSPTTFDILLSTRYGAGCIELINQGRFGNMVTIKGPVTSYVHLENVIGHPKLVNIHGELVETARCVGISFGDEKVELPKDKKPKVKKIDRINRNQ